MMMADYDDDFEYYGEYIRYFFRIDLFCDVFYKIPIKTQIHRRQLFLHPPNNRGKKTFWEAYRELDPQINTNVKHWLWDYVVYYNLDR